MVDLERVALMATVNEIKLCSPQSRKRITASQLKRARSSRCDKIESIFFQNFSEISYISLHSAVRDDSKIAQYTA